ncbi:hypothetical protein ACJ41O_012850 [Fusarium nematophilum]
MSGLEILGAVASSIAIGQAVNGTRKAVKKLREIRHIRQHCDNLAKEIALIELFIKSASQHASPRGRAPRPSGPQEEYQLVSLTVQELDEIRKELDEIVDKYANPSRPHVGIRMKEKAEWLIEGQKIEELRQKAQKTRTDLGMGINFLVMSMIGGMAVQQEEGVGYQIAWEYSINPALRNSEIDVLLKKILSFVQGERFMQTTKVHRAAQQGEPVKQALEEQPWAINELDGRGQAPIHDAVSTNNMKVLEELIVAEADVNRRNWEGYTPLMLAQERGYLDMARTLLEHKECRRHINQQNNQGRTALHFAAFRGSPEGVRMLLEAGASAEKRNMWGETPLHELARSNNMDQAAAEIVRLLQDNKADLEARDNDGLTPALIAVEQNKVPVLRALINAGASLSAVTNYSFNILHVAALYANLEMLGYLVDLDLSDVDPQLLDSDRMAPLECLTWSAEVTDSFLGSNRRPSLAEQDAFLALYFDLLSRHLQRHLSTLKQLLRAAAQRDALTSRHLLGILIEQNHASRRQHLGDWYRDTGIGGYVEDDSWDSLIGCIEDEIQETWRKLHRVDATNKSLTDPEVQFFISEDPESDTED